MKYLKFIQNKTNMVLKPIYRTFSPTLAMASSLSSLFLSPNAKPNFNPYLKPNLHLPSRTQTINFSAKSNPKPPVEDPPPPSEKKSFAVATGELFLALSSRLIKARQKPKPNPNSDDTKSVPITMFRDTERADFDFRNREEQIASVVEDPIDPEVVWEQRLKDVEAERQRRKVTSPGFSFSAAGLLFPYHLGVAQFLIEKGYIKVNCY